MRVDILKILRTPGLRREMCVAVIIATQAREGIVTTQEQAEAAYDKVRAEFRPDAPVTIMRIEKSPCWRDVRLA